MSKIISLFIKFLNRINKIIWKIIVFLSKFIKVDEINHLVNKPDDVKYRLFNVDDPVIIEPFVKIEHKDYKHLIKNNNCSFYLKNKYSLNAHDKNFTIKSIKLKI